MNLKPLIKLLIIIMLFSGLNVFSQSGKTTQLQWEMTTINDKSSLNIVGFRVGFNELPKFASKIKLNSNQKLNVSIEVLNSENLSNDELLSLSTKLKNKIGSGLITKVFYSYQVKVKYGIINFAPLFKENGIIKKVTSFKLSYTYSQESVSERNTASRTSRGFKNSSVLAQGKYCKLSLKADGVYKVTYEFLKNKGVLTTSIFSNLINVYGNHNGMLPEKNGESRVDDLEKNAIKMIDGGDGMFGTGDYFLFYGQSPDKWEYETVNSRFVFHKHLYSKDSYFFVNVDDNTGEKRIANVKSSSSSITNAVSSFDDYQAREDEKINIMSLSSKGGSGKLWVGDVFEATLSANYNFNFPNIDVTSNVTVYSSVLALTNFPTSSSFSMSSGGNSTTIPLPGITRGTHSSVALRRDGILSFLPSSSTVGVNLTYNKPLSQSGVGYLDYIEVNVRRDLTMSNNQMIFRDINSIGAGNVSKYNLTNATNIDQVWDVTNPFEIKNVVYNKVSSVLDFTLETDSLKTFVAYKNSGFLVPVFEGAVLNQNIHSEPTPELLIVYHPLFETQVDRLIQFHESNGLSVLKASVQEVYNEFSGGMQDVTAIKTFVKSFYDKGGVTLPKYLLLFGDGSYDYKNRVQPNHNFVPVYESDNSLSDISSFVTDDFYGLLDDGESIEDHELLDIAVGRLTVVSPIQALNVVDKIINYQKQNVPISQVHNCNSGSSDGSSYGDWRNKLCFVSDDIDENWEADFFVHTENVMDSIAANHPTFNIAKIHMDAYKQTSVSGGERYLDGTEVLRRTVEDGALITTYEGHGGEVGWGSERFLDLSTINGWTNKNRLTIMLTATCEFTKYDDPSRTSAGELCLLNPNGGAVAMFTTTRPVFQGDNKRLINSFFKEAFTKKPDGSPRTLGEIYMETKNNAGITTGGGHRKFALIGDPALNLAFPKQNVVTTAVNNIPVNSAIDTLKALSKISIKGFVSDINGTLISDYNGVVYPTVYDKPLTLSTLGNRNLGDVRTYDLQTSVLYKGKATVKNGLFEFTFLVPKDINYQFGYGKISYYCYNGKEDGAGYFNKINVGGVDLSASADNDGPIVGLYMNDNNFVSGGITDELPAIYAELFDSSGINTSGNGIGHNLTAILDEKTSNPLVLNNYFEADLDSYQSGKINYPVSRLTEGNHTLSIKTWDVHNNSSDNTIDFIVVEKAELSIDHVLNYPNPFTTRTQFFFEHNQSCEFLEVQVQVFTISGKLVKTINTPVKTHGFRVDAIEWNGRDDYGDKIGRGTYIYKVKVTDDKGNKVEKYEKLVLLK
jgi:hypothetical protein